MLFALALVSGWMGRCPELKVGQTAKASVPLEAVCIVSGALVVGHVITVAADISDPGTQLCLEVHAINSASKQNACGDDGSVSINLMQPEVQHTYLIMPKTPRGVPSSIRISAYESVVSPLPPPPPRILLDAGTSGSPSLLGTPPPPLSRSILSLSTPSFPLHHECNDVMSNPLGYVLEQCEPDFEKFCKDVNRHDETEMLNCLELNEPLESQHCQEAMGYYDMCHRPPMLVPMTIASILLLATASMVLLCTLLRCCCRYICVMPVHPADDASTIHDEDLSDEDDMVGSVTPLPSGVKMVETPQSEPAHEEDDDLPAYTEVVQGASIARSAASKDAAPKDPPQSLPKETPPARHTFRPDVQLQ